MPITVKYTNFDISKLNITIPVENMAIPEITKYQLMSIPRSGVYQNFNYKWY